MWKRNKFKCNNVKIYINENHGVSYSRNYGIDRASGEYITFVDSDDFMTKGWYKKISEIIKKDKDVSFILSSLMDDVKKENVL